MEKTHWLEIDYRHESLFNIILALDTSIETLMKRNKEVNWYDHSFLLEDTEPIFGIALIAFQNYINGSINDLHGSVKNKTQYYRLDDNLKHYSKSKIELIIGLANYTKHKDDEKLHGGTQEILTSFELEKSDEIGNSPIFSGIEILSEKSNLLEIMDIVITWRKKLVDDFKSHNP